MPGQLSRQQLTVLILALGSTAIGQSLVFAILPPLGREVNLSELQITSIIALSALLFGTIAPFWGRVSDRLGRKPVMIAGLIGYTLGTVIFASVFYAGLAGALTGVGLYLALMAARGSQALIMSATGPASTAYAADHTTRDQRTKTMARLGTANSLGTILGPAVSGLLATLGLLAPLYFAAVLAASAAVLVWRRLPPTPKDELSSRVVRVKLSFRDPRIMRYLLTAIGLFAGFSGIQQTLGFQLQDKLHLTGIETAQMTGAALMVSAGFTFLTQVTVMQRLKLTPYQFMRFGLASVLVGAAILTTFQTFTVLAVGMAFIGIGMGSTMPAISAGASLAVNPEEQGAAAGLVSGCPALGFVIGPLTAAYLYGFDPALAPAFSAVVFSGVLIALLRSEAKRLN